MPPTPRSGRAWRQQRASSANGTYANDRPLVLAVACFGGGQWPFGDGVVGRELTGSGPDKGGDSCIDAGRRVRTEEWAHVAGVIDEQFGDDRLEERTALAGERRGIGVGTGRRGAGPDDGQDGGEGHP